jgi:ATP-binding cassette subfamily F protein 3
LKTYNGGFLLISHDREFIKKTCNKTIEIDQGGITMFPRPLEEYLEYKEEQLEMKQKFNVKVEREKKHLQQFVDRFSAKASKASQAQSKLKQINKLKTIEILHPLRASRIKIPKIEDRVGIALNVEDMVMGYTDKTVARGISLDVERGEHIAVLGDNGQGKSTFLKTIAGELSSLDGRMRWGANIKVGYYAQHLPAMLNSSETVKAYLERVSAPELSDQEIFEMAGNFLFKDEALKKEVTVLSGGEKARLCLAALLLEKNQVLLMDEPTNHLDFETVEALANALKETNSTVIFVSHNRTFVEILANGIIEVKDGSVRRYHHNYDDYVYHLESKIDCELASESENQGGKSHPKGKGENEVRIKLKEAKKQLSKIERELEKVATEKTELLEWFEKNYSKFSKEKNERLALLTKIHDELESKWMEVQLEIDSANKGA